MTPDDILRYARRLAARHRGDWPLTFDERVSAACWGGLTGGTFARMRGQIIDEMRKHPDGERLYAPEWFDLMPRRAEPDTLEAQDEVEHLLSGLSEQERDILMLVLGWDWWHREVGEWLGLTWYQVWYAVSRLRARLGRER